MTSVVLCPIVIDHTCMLLNTTHCTTHHARAHTILNIPYTQNYLVLKSLQVSIYTEVGANVAVKEVLYIMQ